MKRITVADLIRKKACGNQVNDFKLKFGNEALMTVDNARKASSIQLDFAWAAMKFFGLWRLRRYAQVFRVLKAREPMGDLDWLTRYDVGWATFAAVALDLEIKSEGKGFAALGEPRMSWWRRMFEQRDYVT